MAQNPQKVLKSLVLFLHNTSSRDKACRLTQYTLGFFSHVMKTCKLLDDKKKAEILKIAIKFDKVSSQMSLTRKIFRWGRIVGLTMNTYEMIKQVKEMQNKNKDNRQNFDQQMMKIEIFQNMFSFVGYIFDHILYLYKIQVLQNKSIIDFADEYSNYCWLIEIILGLIMNGLEYMFLKNEYQYAEQEKQIKIQQRLKQNLIDSGRLVFDLPVVAGYINPEKVSNGYIYFFGSLSSIIGCYQIWK